MLQSNYIQGRSTQASILHAWEKDKEQLLRNLGGIESGHRNEKRIRQIEQTIESLKEVRQDDHMRQYDEI